MTVILYYICQDIQMFRNGFFVVVLVSFFSASSFAVTDNNTELTKKFSQAQTLASQGKVTEAIAAYHALIRLNPLLPEAYNNLAGLYLKQKNTKQAKFILEQGLHAHKAYGVLYESLTAINVAMARQAYSKALQIDLKPSDIEIASLSLSEDKASSKKNTIVISKTNKPVVDAPVVRQKKTVVTENPVGKIQRVIATKPVKKIPLNQTPLNQRPLNKTHQVKNTKSIKNVLNAWSAAWSAQAVDMYLSFYHRQYKPSNGLSRKGWVQSRRYRLKKPDWIKVGLSNFKVEKKSAKQAVVSFKQSYQSNSFRDKSAKQVVLLYTEDGWKIFREMSL